MGQLKGVGNSVCDASGMPLLGFLSHVRKGFVRQSVCLFVCLTGAWLASTLSGCGWATVAAGRREGRVSQFTPTMVGSPVRL